MNLAFLKNINPLGLIIGAFICGIGLLAATGIAGFSLLSDIQEIQLITQEASDSTALQIQLNQLKNQNEQLESWLGDQSQFSKIKTFPDLVLSVARTSGINSISKLSIAQTDESGFEEFYHISFAGTYSRVMRFINKLELSAIPIRITKINMLSKPDSQIKCDLSVGVLTEPDKPKSAIN